MVFQLRSVPFSPAKRIIVHRHKTPTLFRGRNHVSAQVLTDCFFVQIFHTCALMQPQRQSVRRLKTILFHFAQFQTRAQHFQTLQAGHLYRCPKYTVAKQDCLALRQFNAQIFCKLRPQFRQFLPGITCAMTRKRYFLCGACI